MTFPRLQAPSLRLLRVLLLGCSAVLAGCHTVPYAKQGVLPPRIEVAEGSPQRAALNAQTYDATVRHVRRLFYRDTSHFTHIARERRASVIAQPGEDGFYNALKEVLACGDAERTRHQRRRPAQRRQERGNWLRPYRSVVWLGRVRPCRSSRQSCIQGRDTARLANPEH